MYAMVLLINKFSMRSFGDAIFCCLSVGCKNTFVKGREVLNENGIAEGTISINGLDKSDES